MPVFPLILTLLAIYLYVKRNHPEKLDAHVPEYAKKIVGQYKLPE